MKLSDALRLLRPWQWYKNLVIFVPLIFSENLTNFSLWPVLIVGFAVLCLVSSISYAINDIFDREADRCHPEKRKRPIASGRMSMSEAFLIIVALGILTVWLTTLTNFAFSLLASALFFSNLLYSALLKNVPLVDVHIIAINFVIRVVSGAFIIDLGISPWLVVVIFILALFLAVGKRKAEIEKFGQEKLKKAYNSYSKELLDRLTDVTAAMLMLSYILFTAFTHELKLMITIPIATFLVFRYLYFIHSSSVVARKSERVFLDKQMCLGIILWIVLSIALTYAL